MGSSSLGVHINYSHFERDKVLSEYQTVNTPKQPIEDLSRAQQEKVFDDLARWIEEIGRQPEAPSSGGAERDIAGGPLADIEGKAVPIEQLLALETGDGANWFSDEVCDLLQQARESPHFKCDGVPIVDAATYLHAALLAGERGLEGERGGSGSGILSHHSLVKALNERGATLHRLREVQWPESLVAQRSIPAEHRSGGLAGPDMTRILTNAARLARGRARSDATIFGRHALASVDPVRGRARGLLATRRGRPTLQRRSESFLGIHPQSLSAARKGTPAAWGGHYCLGNYRRRFSEGFAGVGQAEGGSALQPVLRHRRDGFAGERQAWRATGRRGARRSSTFMHMLEEAVDRATEDDAHTPELFIKNVVHIRFNAWHYISCALQLAETPPCA